MANYWAITIGINQYRHLQPLMHAQNDALFMHRFLTETAGIPADHCALLSDLATSVGHQVVYPDKPALSEWVQTITQQVNADDVLWFFFSGYGVQLEGNDYLMPIDGDPGQIRETGLAAADLIETLAQLPTNKTVLVLDINRSQGSFSGQAIGAQVISLAEANELPLLLSCQPEQYSHETFGVRHGLFTAALLEALQQKCSTLGAINDYVSKRLPELCEHHWRPIQNPVCVMGEAQRVAVVIPDNQPATDVNSQVVMSGLDADKVIAGKATPADSAPADRIPVGASASVSAASTAADSMAVASTGAASTVLAGSGGTLLATASNHEPLSSGQISDDLGDDLGRDLSLKNGRSGSNESALTVTNGKGSLVTVDRGEPRPGVSGAKLRNWGLAALALLMVGVLLKQPFVRTAWVGLTERITALGDGSDEAVIESTDVDVTDASADPSPAELDEPVEAASPATETANPDANEAAVESEASESQQTEETAETPEAETVEAETPDSSETADNPSAETESASTNAAGDSTTNTASAETKALLTQANTALSQRQYSEALITLQQVPKDERDSAFASILTKARAGAAEAQQFNASVLTDARTSIQPTQASQFSDAISKARRIQPGEPYYEEAQQDIRSWSQIILDIAEGRATGGNLDGAIAAANVMPYDNSEFRQKAQDRIAFWQQRQNSRSIIVEAQAIPRSGQASTYQKGIVKLREVPIEHPEYETAQRLADEWSERIFSIAQARAAQGRQSAAIQAAVLVPAGTTSYEPTQQAIKRWRSEE